MPEPGAIGRMSSPRTVLLSSIANLGLPPEAVKLPLEEKRVNLRFIDWIWHVRGSLTLSPGQSSDDAFNRLDPLFRQTGTSHQRTSDTLSFRKKNQAAQDRMSVFNGGALRIEKGMAGSVLHYHLTSRALLFCFLAPLLFLCIAQFTIAKRRPPHERS